MPEPNRHPPQETLIEYASGRAAEGVSLVVACHATLCGRCQAQIAALDALAGATLGTGSGLPLREGLLDQIMAQLDEAPPEPPPEPPPARSTAAAALGLPRPLLRYVDRAGGLKWRFRLPGIHMLPLRLGPSAPADAARLVRFKSGLTVPLHSHAGTEYTLTFTGAFEDAGVRYARGDVSVRHTGEHHTQHILPGEDCVVLAINQGPRVPLTWAGRLLSFLVDRRPA